MSMKTVRNFKSELQKFLLMIICRSKTGISGIKEDSTSEDINATPTKINKKGAKSNGTARSSPRKSEKDYKQLNDPHVEENLMDENGEPLFDKSPSSSEDSYPSNEDWRNKDGTNHKNDTEEAEEPHPIIKSEPQEYGQVAV